MKFRDAFGPHLIPSATAHGGEFFPFDDDSEICYNVSTGTSFAGIVRDRVRPMMGVSFVTNRRAAVLDSKTCCLVQVQRFCPHYRETCRKTRLETFTPT